jgi:hypothetical protein
LSERFAASDEEVPSIEDVIPQSETGSLSDDLKIDIDFE